MFDMELKLDGGALGQAGIRQALTLEGTPQTAHREHGFDTPDKRLAAEGLLLTMSFDDGAWYQVLSGSDGGTKMARIDRVPVPPRNGKRMPDIDLERHSSKAACHALKKALDWQPTWPVPSLIEQLGLSFERRMRDVSAGKGRLRIRLDMGRLHAEGKSWPWCEVTLTLDSREDLEDLFALARRLVRDHGLCLSTADPGWRGLNLIRPVGHARAAVAEPVSFDPDGASAQQLQAMVASCLGHILPNAGALAAGQCDPEQVHQLRVGIRRLRTVLREIGSLSNDVVPGWDVSLAEAFHGLGAQRDQDLIGELGRQMRDAGAPEFMPCPDANPPAVMSRSIVSHPTFQGTLLDLLAFSLCRTTSPSGHRRSLRSLLERRLERLHRKVQSDGKRFASLPEAHQHRARKRLKRLRYLSEFARPLFKGGKVDRYLEALNPAQDALGAYNDRLVALDMWRRHAQADQKAWFAVGWLSANRDQAAQACRQALRKVGKATRFWPVG